MEHPGTSNAESNSRAVWLILTTDILCEQGGNIENVSSGVSLSRP
jgi:hypothetical protein